MATTATVGYQNTTDVILDMNDVVAGGTDVYNIIVTRDFLVTGVTVIATATQAGGTITVGKGANAIVSGLACAAANDVVQAASLDIGHTAFSKGDTLRITATTNGARGTVIVRTAPLALGSARTITST